MNGVSSGQRRSALPNIPIPPRAAAQTNVNSRMGIQLYSYTYEQHITCREQSTAADGSTRLRLLSTPNKTRRPAVDSSL